MPAPLDHALLGRQLRDLLSRGHSTGPQLRAILGISQPVFSRLARKTNGVLSVGPRSARKYALIREIIGVVTPISVYDLGPDTPRRLGRLTPIHPSGFWYESDGTGRFYDDLPWFLQDLRPVGYLGRLVPRVHADLALPADIRLWNDRATLTYLTRRASDPIGALLLGDESYQAFLQQFNRPARGIGGGERAQRYPALAVDVLAQGPAGSSAAGEQAKFLTRRDDVPVIVKFSPPSTGPAAIRTADLLIAEHIALEVLRSAGREAALSELVLAEERVFLEVQRFDRDGGRRIGQISMAAVDAEHVGLLGDWTATARALCDAGVISRSDREEIRYRDLFGKFIANSDRHLGNVSFRLQGDVLAGVAPTYDMLPMHYRPVQGEVIDRPWAPPLPNASDADIAREAWNAARLFWEQTAAHPRISQGFRDLAAENLMALRGLAPVLSMLPV